MKVTQLCPTLCGPQVRILEWVGVLISRGSSQPQGSNPGPESSVKNRVLGFPWWLRSEESACQWRRWVQSLVREDPSASEQLSLCAKLLSLGATAAEPTTPGAHARARARTSEATAP